MPALQHQKQQQKQNRSFICIGWRYAKTHTWLESVQHPNHPKWVSHQDKNITFSEVSACSWPNSFQTFRSSSHWDQVMNFSDPFSFSFPSSYTWCMFKSGCLSLCSYFVSEQYCITTHLRKDTCLLRARLFSSPFSSLALISRSNWARSACSVTSSRRREFSASASSSSSSWVCSLSDCASTSRACRERSSSCTWQRKLNHR